MKPPAFQFYVDDFIGGTCDLTTLEVGCYIRLLCYQWSKGKIPEEKGQLKLICGALPSENVLKKFPNGKNKRMEKERKNQAIWREKCSLGGKKSAEKRALRVVETVAPRVVPTVLEGEGAPKGNSPLSTLHSPLSREREAGKPPAHLPEIQIPAWEEVQAQCQKIGLVEWRAKDWFDEMNQSGWRDNKGREVMHWQSFLTRVKTWWERDGRPMTPPAGKNGTGRTATPLDLKTIIGAKESKASAIRKKHCSDTAIDSVWNDKAKQSEYFKLKKEIKDLNDQLSNMA